MHFPLLFVYVTGDSQICIDHLPCFYDHKFSCKILLAEKHPRQQIQMVRGYILQCCKNRHSPKVIDVEGGLSVWFSIAQYIAEFLKAPPSLTLPCTPTSAAKNL